MVTGYSFISCQASFTDQSPLRFLRGDHELRFTIDCINIVGLEPSELETNSNQMKQYITLLSAIHQLLPRIIQSPGRIRNWQHVRFSHLFKNKMYKLAPNYNKTFSAEYIFSKKVNSKADLMRKTRSTSTELTYLNLWVFSLVWDFLNNSLYCCRIIYSESKCHDKRIFLHISQITFYLGHWTLLEI